MVRTVFLLLLAAGCAAPDRTAPAAAAVRVLRLPLGASVPDADVDAAGTVHVAYVAAGEVWYATAAADGESLGLPVRVNSVPGTAATPGRFRGPDLALSPAGSPRAGRVHVAWYANDYEVGRPHGVWGVRYAHLDPPGAVFTPEVNLNHRPSDSYSLAAGPGGTVLVAWTADGLFVHRSGNDGESFSGGERVDGADPCECCATRLAFAPDGAAGLIYREKGGNLRDVHAVVWGRGFTRPERRRLGVSPPWRLDACPMSGMSLAPSRAGYLAAWQSEGRVSWARLDGRGRAQEPAEARTMAIDGWFPVVLEAGDGTVCVSWKEGDRLCWQRFDADGTARGAPTVVAAANRHRHAGVVTGAGFLLLD